MSTIIQINTAHTSVADEDCTIQPNSNDAFSTPIRPPSTKHDTLSISPVVPAIIRKHGCIPPSKEHRTSSASKTIGAPNTKQIRHTVVTKLIIHFLDCIDGITGDNEIARQTRIAYVTEFFTFLRTSAIHVLVQRETLWQAVEEMIHRYEEEASYWDFDLRENIIRLQRAMSAVHQRDITVDM